MRYTGNIGKKIYRFIIASEIAALTLGVAKTISEPKVIPVEKNLDDSDFSNDPEPIDDSSDFSTNVLEDDGSFKNLDEAKESIKEQFANSKIYIDNKYNGYISSIKVDVRSMEIEFKDGEKISGDCLSGYIADIELEKFEIYDSEYIQYKIDTGNDLTAEGMDIETHGIKVLDEYRNGCIGNLNEIFLSVDYSNCKKIWKDNKKINDDDIEYLNNNKSLEELILTNMIYESESKDEILKMKNDNLRTFIISFRANENQFADFDLNECENLEFFSGGILFGATNLNGIKDCKKLKVLDFGQLIGGQTFGDIVNLSFDEEKENIQASYDTSKYEVGNVDNVFISDLSAIMYNPSTEVIDVSLLRFVNSDHFFEVIQTLPNLKRIVGNDINSVSIYSEDLSKYCDSKEIKTPFTERTKELKQYIRNILDSIITPEMNDYEKTEKIAKYILEKMEYDDELSEKEDAELTPEDILRGWGENPLYNLLEERGLCEGYADLATIFMTECNINVYTSAEKYVESDGHIYNIIQIDGIYYELDLTSLDAYLEEHNIPIDMFGFNINDVFYMDALGSLTMKNATYIEPAEVYRIRKELLEEGIYFEGYDDENYYYLDPNNTIYNNIEEPYVIEVPITIEEPEEPNVEEPEEPNVEEPNVEEPNAEEPEEPNVEEPNAEEPDAEEPEEPNFEESNVEEPEETTSEESNNEMSNNVKSKKYPNSNSTINTSIKNKNTSICSNKFRRFVGVLKALGIARPVPNNKVSRSYNMKKDYHTWTVEELNELCKDTIAFDQFLKNKVRLDTDYSK